MSDRSAATREKMLEVAETLFARMGYEGAHLERIASEVGVRKTALYYYFDSKEALYVRVLERMLLDYESKLGAVLRLELPTAKKAEQLLDALNDLLAEHPNYSQILLRIFVDRIPLDNSTIAPIIERVVGSSLRFIRDGVEEGVFRNVSARHLFQSTLGMAVFHYAGGEFSAAVLGVDDVFGESAVSWRRQEFRRVILGAVLVDPE